MSPSKPDRILLFLLGLSLVISVFAITDQEQQACQALLTKNRLLSATRVSTFNASRCCSDLKFDTIEITCNSNQSAITGLIVSRSDYFLVDLEFNEFSLFHQLTQLDLWAPSLRPSQSGSCLPPGLGLLPNLTSLVVHASSCLPPDDYFGSLSQLSTLVFDLLNYTLAPPSGISALNATLNSLTISYEILPTVATPYFLIPPSWYSLNLTTLVIGGRFNRTSLFDFISGMPNLTSLDIDVASLNSGSPALPILPQLRELSVRSQRVDVPPNAFYGFDSLLNLHITGSMTQFPSSAFQLPNIREVLLDFFFVPTPAVISDSTDTWNSTSITQLALDGKGIAIDLPSSINNLTGLQSLRLITLQLNRLPANLSGLVNLRKLQFESIFAPNESIVFAPLTTIPNVTDLTINNVGSNPAWIWSLVNLRHLRVFSPFDPVQLNQEIGNMVNLEDLDLWVTLRGEFPPGFANLTRLRGLQILIQGGLGPTVFPSFLTNLTSLEYIHFRSFTLTPGARFPDLVNFPNLRAFILGDIRGMITPPSLVGANTLENLGLAAMPSLTTFPEIPAEGLPNLRALQFFSLPLVTEPLPLGYYNCSSLEVFNFQSVPCRDSLAPLATARWPNLSTLYLLGTGHTGPVPPGISQLQNLRMLYLAVLGLNGSFAPLTGFPNLETLDVGDNSMSSFTLDTNTSPKLKYITLRDMPLNNFPVWISEASSLEGLSLNFGASPSQLPFTFPDLSRFPTLKTLSISGTRFSGPVPDVFGQLRRLESVVITSTNLNGPIPASLFTSPSNLQLPGNAFTGIPTGLPAEDCRLASLNLGRNQIVGSNLSIIGSCARLQEINLVRNQLGPIIPATIISLPRLFNFLADNNSFSILETPTPSVPVRPLRLRSFSLAHNNFTGPITDDMLRIMINWGPLWSFDNNALECPRHVFYPTLATFNWPGIFGQTVLSGNHLCIPQNTTALACPSLFFGPNPNGAFRTTRLPCKPYSWNCVGPQPARDAPCVAPGVWLILGSVQPSPNQTIVIGGNTTVQGNFTVPIGSGITITSGAVVTVQGCVSISGDLTIDVSNDKPTVNGTRVDVLVFDSSVCNTTDKVDFGRVTVVGGGECSIIEGLDQVNSRILSVVFTVFEAPACRAPSVDGVSSSTAAIIGGVVGGIVVLAAIVAIVLLYKFRGKVVPSLMLNRRLKRLSKGQST